MKQFSEKQNPFGFLYWQQRLKKIYWISFIDPAKYLRKFWRQVFPFMDNDAEYVSVKI